MADLTSFPPSLELLLSPDSPSHLHRLSLLAAFPIASTTPKPCFPLSHSSASLSLGQAPSPPTIPSRYRPRHAGCYPPSPWLPQPHTEGRFFPPASLLLPLGICLPKPWAAADLTLSHPMPLPPSSCYSPREPKESAEGCCAVQGKGPPGASGKPPAKPGGHRDWPFQVMLVGEQPKDQCLENIKLLLFHQPSLRGRRRPSTGLGASLVTKSARAPQDSRVPFSSSKNWTFSGASPPPRRGHGTSQRSPYSPGCRVPGPAHTGCCD